ncbi:MAG: phosphate ABC transporter substrate-binding protein PstS family protein [Methylovulum sp.]|uniref:PstS family phosphate ABC transporter substrate-binding protein n=1 Tax=Methylovulum sp. TaxID=1916980 RepID=UPI002603A582|nr:phosphate ABC transporter substrate-binding protein PstS family protein [Methylovulum sp.]MDD2724718.1 phosphate ABC transporter substrate-binding protein PstS family protein [Methylovulum sp.]MDD5124657.1 phosphate ABC transporter substrate-binding protein PstS family protein [Methylovulum sp.]
MTLSFKSKSLIMAMSLVSVILASPAGQAVQTVEAGVPEYQKASGVSGNLSSVGSDTLANQMTLWAEAFNRFYPNVNIQIQAAGSSTAPPALTEGTSNLGPMSREMKDDELEAFEKKFGYKPTKVPVAVDALAVFVNKDNPLKGLTIDQVDAIFSSTRKCGYSTDILNWGDAGVAKWKDKSIQLYGRNSVSGTYGYFKEHALCKGDFKNNVNEQPGSASVIQSVTTSVNGIGYSGLGYVTSGIKALPLAKKGSNTFVAATPENALAGKYPLARFLYVYVNKKPNQPLAPLENEFIKMVLSKTGQEVVIKDGYIPLPAKVIKKALATLK